jgi:hypothetical protein
MKMISPKGIARNAIVVPCGKQCNQSEGYSVDLVIDLKDEEGKTFVRTLEKLRDDYITKLLAGETDHQLGSHVHKGTILCDEIVFPDFDEGRGELSGKHVIKFHQNTVVGAPKDLKRFDIRPVQYDKAGELLDEHEQFKSIFDGSVIRVGFRVFPYYIKVFNRAGLSLRPSAIQIIKAAVDDSESSNGFNFPDETVF